jgi:N-acetylmuramoyl-L-alanine amidase
LKPNRTGYSSGIDRFGRVYRIVGEADAANHAGYSVWSDEKWLYLNLNESFLGISFEAQTEPGQMDAPVSPAQLRAAAMLTEMLRSRYGIAATNCVTHAQVSVNPTNMRIGYHTDWASSFPFAAVGLPDNYAQPPASLLVAGFEADPAFFHAAGPRLGAAVRLAETGIAQTSEAAGLPLRFYRERLRMQYRARLAELRASPDSD